MIRLFHSGNSISYRPAIRRRFLRRKEQIAAWRDVLILVSALMFVCGGLVYLRYTIFSLSAPTLGDVPLQLMLGVAALAVAVLILSLLYVLLPAIVGVAADRWSRDYLPPRTQSHGDSVRFALMFTGQGMGIGLVGTFALANVGCQPENATAHALFIAALLLSASSWLFLLLPVVLLSAHEPAKAALQLSALTLSSACVTVVMLTVALALLTEPPSPTERINDATVGVVLVAIITVNSFLYGLHHRDGWRTLYLGIAALVAFAVLTSAGLRFSVTSMVWMGVATPRATLTVVPERCLQLAAALDARTVRIKCDAVTPSVLRDVFVLNQRSDPIKLRFYKHPQSGDLLDLPIDLSTARAGIDITYQERRTESQPSMPRCPCPARPARCT